VLDLHLQAFVPSGGADQTVRLYRNSRDDELFTATAVPGTPLDHTITLAAIPGDRFLVAVAARTVGTINIGLNLTATASTTPFPATCQVAVPFASAKGTTVEDVCGATVFTHYAGLMNTTPPSLDRGPFPEQGKAATVFLGETLRRGPAGTAVSPKLDWTQDVTVQFWALASMPPSLGRDSIMFSDMDPDFGTGIEIYLAQASTMTLEVQTCAAPPIGSNPVVFAIARTMYQTLGDWHFIRAVRTSGQVRLCVDGAPAASVNAVPCTDPSMYGLQLGGHESTHSASFGGQLDDVRVFTGALPCDPPP
jgi:hypothetical protein